MKLTVVGCGDAFGSGGRLQTCFHIGVGGHEALIDCGATAVLGLNRLGIDPNRISSIFISHLHGDHFSGLVWLLIHANHIAHRTSELTVTGPRGIRDRFTTVAEALFPGCTETARRFDLNFVEYRDGAGLDIGPFHVTAHEVVHPSGAPSYALRVDCDGTSLAFSGDTEWVDTLVDAAQGADLFITECYGFERPARYHMHWDIIRANLDRLGAKRLLLTHMSAEMLANRSKINDARVLLADDGLVVEI